MTVQRWQRIAWAIGAHDLAVDVDETDLDFREWAEAEHGETALLSLAIAEAIRETEPAESEG